MRDLTNGGVWAPVPDHKRPEAAHYLSQRQDPAASSLLPIASCLSLRSPARHRGFRLGALDEPFDAPDDPERPLAAEPGERDGERGEACGGDEGRGA